MKKTNPTSWNSPSMEVINAISEITLKIQNQYPELYQFLDEEPLTIPSESHPKIDEQVHQNYLNSLRQMLDHYINNHPEKGSQAA